MGVNRLSNSRRAMFARLSFNTEPPTAAEQTPASPNLGEAAKQPAEKSP